jgi:hypothetical protein
MYGYRPDPATERYPLALISPASEKSISSTLAELRQRAAVLQMHPDDAQARGLSRDLWDARTLRRLGAAAVVPAPLVGLAHGLQPAVIYAGVALVFLGWLKTRRRQRDTQAGLVAAAHWLGVRAELDENEAFPTQPPTAVVLWERLLSYGAALGVAAGAIRPIPMGAESDTRAWSSYGGRWRQVRVRYPRLFPLGWGEDPLTTALKAFAAAAGSGLFVYLLVSTVFPLAELGEELSTTIATAIVLLPVAVGLGAVTVLVRALADLTATTEVTGEILRLRRFGSDEKTRYYVAVDDGTADTVRAWRVRGALYAPLQQHEVVVASVTTRLRYVRAIEPAPARASAFSAVPASADPL